MGQKEIPNIDGQLPAATAQRPGEQLRITETPTSISDELHRFAMLSSIRGLSRILKSRSLAWKIFWFVFIVASLIIAILLSANVIRSYVSYDTIQELREHLNYHLPFPSVTICNSQAVDKDRYESLNASLVSKLFGYLSNLRQQYGSSESLLEDRYFLFENMGRSHSNRLGFALDTLILPNSCIFTFLNTSTSKDAFRPCKSNDIRLIQTPRYFNCYMVTPGPDIINHTTDLKMDIYLNVPGLFDNYNISHLPYNEDDTTGARVCVHTPLSWPYTDEIGIDIEPGTKTMIDVSPAKLKFLPHYGGQVCTEHNLLEAVMEAHTDMGSTKFAYTSKFCKDLRLQNLTVERCHCIDPRKPYPPSLRQYEFCGKLNGHENYSLNETLYQLRCADNIELDNSYSANQHDCAFSCETCQYLYQTSQSLWPTKNKEVQYYQEMLKPIPKLREKYKAYDHIHNLSRINAVKSRKLLMKEETIRNNFIRLHIFRSDFTASEKRMALKTTKESMISQVGGIFHLLTGITFACVVEVLECLYYLLKKTLLPQSDGSNNGLLLRRLRRRPYHNDPATNCLDGAPSAYEMQKLRKNETETGDYNHQAAVVDGAPESA